MIFSGIFNHQLSITTLSLPRSRSSMLTTAPDFFTEDTPTAVLVRQVLGAIAQFDKATTIAKLKAAQDRKIAAGDAAAGNPMLRKTRKWSISPGGSVTTPMAVHRCLLQEIR